MLSGSWDPEVNLLALHVHALPATCVIPNRIPLVLRTANALRGLHGLRSLAHALHGLHGLRSLAHALHGLHGLQSLLQLRLHGNPTPRAR